jgi:hypothetical protein
VQHRLVVHEVLAARQHGAGVGLFEVVQPGAALLRPSLQRVDGTVEGVELLAVQRAAHDEPAVAPEGRLVDGARAGAAGGSGVAHGVTSSSWRSRAMVGAQSSTDGWVRSMSRVTGAAR